VALAIFVGFVLLFPVEINRTGDELIYFGTFRETGLPIWLTLPIIFIAVALIMTMLGEGVARTFIKFEPLEAYRLDIAGSILGIIGFALLAYLSAPPVVWGVISGLLFMVLIPRGWVILRVVAIVGLAVMLGRESFQDGAHCPPITRSASSTSGMNTTSP
jgi:mannose/fructose/N-acetylgalactosamine-specific phosphotransferase system component IIC